MKISPLLAYIALTGQLPGQLPLGPGAPRPTRSGIPADPKARAKEKAARKARKKGRK